MKFFVLGMKLPKLRSFAIIGEENKKGLALEDNTSVNVFVHRCNGRERNTRVQMMVPQLELLMPETSFWNRSLLVLWQADHSFS